MNRYDFDAEKAPNGWHAWHQEVHKACKTYAKFKGEPILFGSELEALREARRMHLEYLSLPISGATMNQPKVKDVKFATAETRLRQALKEAAA